MKSKLVLSVGLLLTCVFQAQADHHVQEGFDAGKYVGKWYGLAMAADSPRFMKIKDTMRMPMSTFTLNADGGLDVTVSFSTPQGCQTKHRAYKNGAEPGHFESEDDKNGNNSIFVMETDYDTYALMVSLHTQENGQTSVKVSLFGRTPDLTPELKQKFEALAKAKNFSAENFSFPIKDGECELV
ncbi:lipocalin-like [Microcaecilia unicolor]|uniref:Lipocalin-like n=1 Tax=Microcaecilia unicolor TaxID=1415580 RepID=A0A6P7YAK9_9AMPH|nr:lipocalin-like [Microcaecilia unicolor]